MSERMMKIGTVGTGIIVEAFIDAVNKNKYSEVVAAYIRKESNNPDFGSKMSIPKVHYSYEELLNDENVNFIYIASPNSLHYQMAKLALESGKNVISEKPFTSNQSEALELRELAIEKNLYIFEAISILHMPNYLLMKENINKLDNISLVQANYSQFSSKYNKLLAGENPNVFSLEYSGGSLMDINIYNIHAIIDIFGMPAQAMYYANKHTNGIDVSGTAILKYDNHLAISTGAKDSTSLNFFQVQGTNGFVNVTNGINGVGQIEINIDNTKETKNVQNEDNRLYYEVEKFETIYRDENREAHDELLEHSCHVMEVLDSLRKDSNIVFPSDMV